MTMATKREASSGIAWTRAVRRWAAAAILGALAACGGSTDCPSCAIEDLRFYDLSWIAVDPGTVTVDPGQAAAASVTVGFDDAASDLTNPREYQGLSVVPPTSGVTLTRTTDACLVPPRFTAASSTCRTYRLDVTADAVAAGVRDVTLSAVWSDGGTRTRAIERVETFRVALRAPPPVVAPDFQVAVGVSPGGVSATTATLPVTITRVGGFAEAVTLDYAPLASGIAGALVAEPVPTDARTLQLQIPARYTAGGRAELRITATAASGRTKTLDFVQFIEPLFRIAVEPATASLTSAAPLVVDVSIEPGPRYRTASLGVVELTLSDLPPGVTAEWPDNATPTGPVLPAVKAWRRLRLVTNGVSGVMGPLTIRGTARGVPADMDGTAPFTEAVLDLTVRAGLEWQFVGNNLTYGTTEANAIGIGLQADNRPAIAWLEGAPGRVFVRRYDGTTFAPSPPRVDLGFGLVAPALSVRTGIDEASFALTATDASQVVFTAERGASLALGRAERAAVEWSVGPALVVGDPADPATTRARSPRIATGPAADAVVVSYIREANAATTTGGVLHVLRTFGNGVLSPLPTALPGGALNASPTGSVKRHSNALALRADGHPWVAWIEQPTNPALADRLWIRGYDGSDWGPAIAVPTPAAPVGTSVQLLVEPAGTVVVAWLEGGPAQLKLARYDPSSQRWTPLDNSGNGRGSLNATALSPALDVHLARHPDGRLLVAWTEGDAEPRVWVKRLDGADPWQFVGTTVSEVDRYSKTPRIVSDANNRLYVAWAAYTNGHTPATPRAYAEIDVAQWIFP